MDIGSTDGIGGLGRIQGPHGPGRLTPPEHAQAASTPDRVEISPEARLVSEARSLPSVRQERIDEVRGLIESGKFDTAERLEKAIDRFLEELG